MKISFISNDSNKEIPNIKNHHVFLNKIDSTIDLYLIRDDDLENIIKFSLNNEKFLLVSDSKNPVYYRYLDGEKQALEDIFSFYKDFNNLPSIIDILLELNFNPSHKSFLYIIYIVKTTKVSSLSSFNLKKDVYPKVAKKFNTSPRNVSSSIYRSLESIYINGYVTSKGMIKLDKGVKTFLSSLIIYYYNL